MPPKGYNDGEWSTFSVALFLKNGEWEWAAVHVSKDMATFTRHKIMTTRLDFTHCGIYRDCDRAELLEDGSYVVSVQY